MIRFGFGGNPRNINGKVRSPPVEDDKDEESPFAGLEGLVVDHDDLLLLNGMHYNKAGYVIGSKSFAIACLVEG